MERLVTLVFSKVSQYRVYDLVTLIYMYIEIKAWAVESHCIWSGFWYLPDLGPWARVLISTSQARLQNARSV